MKTSEGVVIYHFKLFVRFLYDFVTTLRAHYLGKARDEGSREF